MHTNSRLFFTHYMQSITATMGKLSGVQCRLPSAPAFVVIAFICIHPMVTKAQEIINIYPGAIPGSITNNKTETKEGGMFRNVTTPTLEIYLPEKEKTTGTAVIICPGGGYSVVVYDGEGINTAKTLQQKGIAAFVLKYRLPDDSIMADKKYGPLQDVQQAFKLVREQAARWGVNPAKIGIMGFSAGGHLAATAATHFAKPLIANPENTSLRPDFQVLVYPVISMQDGLTHNDSRRKLLGEQATKEDKDKFSGELNITAQTLPLYITHTSDDRVVNVRNSIRYYEAIQEKNIPAEMHIYQQGGHGFIFRYKEWIEPLLQWMRLNKWIEK